MNTYADKPELQTVKAAVTIANATLHGELGQALTLESLLRIGGEVAEIFDEARNVRIGEFLVHFTLEEDSECVMPIITGGLGYSLSSRLMQMIQRTCSFAAKGLSRQLMSVA